MTLKPVRTRLPRLAHLAAVLSLAIPTLFATEELRAQGWRDLGFGKVGPSGIAMLTATPIRLGQPLNFTLDNASRNSTAYFAIGSFRRDVRIWGGTLVPALEIVVAAPVTAAGKSSLTFPVPNDPRLLGVELFAQCVVLDNNASFGLAISNAITASVCPQLKSNFEDFATSTFFDPSVSSGTWGNGKLTFARIGGTGIHGDFDPTLGVEISDPAATVKIYEWDLDTAGGFKIPRSHTLTNQDEFVTDGRFFFRKMIVTGNVEVRFVGSIAARISVRGVVHVDGVLCSNGEFLPPDGANGNLQKSTLIGEAGGRGGAMGGAGGQGADRGNGVGNQPNFHGRAGRDVVLLAGHAYAGRFIGSGGLGSPQWPLSGRIQDITFTYFNVISQMSNRGGGGGGFTSVGGFGDVIWGSPNQANQIHAAPGTTPGGSSGAFPAGFPVYTNAFTRQDHFLGGGSGGGGGGSSCGGAIKSIATDRFRIGRAGGGGGGALGLRIGGDLEVSGAGRLEARGGAGAVDMVPFSIRGMMTPGGGGSGGSLYLQVHGKTDNTGSISVAGGAGGRTIGTPSDQVFNGMVARGGDGSEGILHFETNQDPANYPVGTTVPANAPVAKLGPLDEDPEVAVGSKWYPGGKTFVRYEIDAMVNGSPRKYSDDPRFGVLAYGLGERVQFTVQGAQLIMQQPNGEWVPAPFANLTDYTPYVGPFSLTRPTLYGSAPAGYRFDLRIDRSLGPIEIKSVTIYWCD